MASNATPITTIRFTLDLSRSSVNLIVVIGVALLAMVLGIVFTFIEHSRPLRTFVGAVEQLGAGKTDHLQASQVSGVYRKVVTLINDAIDAAVAKGGGTRRVADLQQVLGDVPEQPAMSAFAFGGPAPAAAPIPVAPPSSTGPDTAGRPLPNPPASVSKALPKPPPAPGGRPLPPQRPGPSPVEAEPAAAPVPAVNGSANPEWRRIFEDFLATKQQCGESTTSLTYEKFEVTLRKNQQAIIDRHGVSLVKFSVYVKDGKAALKASPIRE